VIEIRSGRLEPAQGTGPSTDKDTFYFDRQVETCWVALTGYRLTYADDDHHVRTISVHLSAGLQETESGPGVVVKATLLLDDKNGDDAFAGWAEYLLFVELGRRLSAWTARHRPWPGGSRPAAQAGLAR
jgi:hypothetical protein